MVVESDCARIVKALQRKEDRLEISFIIVEAVELSQLLENWKVSLVKRESNLVANELALLARRNLHTAVWLRKAPACVLELVKNDCKL